MHFEREGEARRQWRCSHYRLCLSEAAAADLPEVPGCPCDKYRIDPSAVHLRDVAACQHLIMAALLKALKQAQCEQALHELSRDLDEQRAVSVSIGGLLSASFPKQMKMDRYSERALAKLRAWLIRPTIKRYR